MSLIAAATVLIVGCSIVGVALGRWPLLRANRSTITLLGVALLLASGAVTLQQAYAALDLNTLLLLFSMMVLNGQLFLAGFFGVVTQRVVRWRWAHTLRALVIVTAGVLSALFLNDIVVLMMTPLVLETTRTLRRDPIPYLLGLATAANVGSVAMITGNPQNIIIGSASGISYGAFAAALAPTALIGLVICWGVIVPSYRQEFRASAFIVSEGQPARLFTLLQVAQADLVPFGLVTAALSNIMSNVPAVLLLQCLVSAFANPSRAWLMLAAASTLAGNLTLRDSVSNLIVAEVAGRWNVRLAFMAFKAHLRVGLPITLLALLMGLLLI